MNTDLISREAVISIIEESQEDDADEWMGYPWKVTPNLLMDEVRKLPPVTPKQTEITLESALDYLHKIGWLQRHDKEMTKFALSLTPKQRTGHWIECEDEVKVYCSECKEKSDYPMNYCPNCGADMRESEEQG